MSGNTSKGRRSARRVAALASRPRTALLASLIALSVVLASPMPAIAADNHEVDSRTSMPVVEPGSAPLAREINPNGDVDWASLRVTAGQSYVIETVPDRDEWFDSKLEVYLSGSDTPFASDDDGGLNFLSRVVITAPTDAIWHIRVTGYNYYTTGSYALNVYKLTPARVTGTVSGVAGIALPNARVTAYALEGGQWSAVAASTTDESGRYDMALVPGVYRVGYALAGGQYAEEYYPNAASVVGAADITVAAGSTLALDEVALVRWGRVYGSVRNSDGSQPLESVSIEVYRKSGANWIAFAWTSTDRDGSWSMALTEGSYKFGYSDASGRYLSMYHPTANSLEYAQEVVVGSSSPALAARLYSPASMSGRVTSVIGGAGIAGAEIAALRLVDGEWTAAAATTSRQDGAYSLGGLIPGTYIVRAVAKDVAVATTFYGGTTAIEAHRVLLESGAIIPGIDIVVGDNRIAAASPGINVHTVAGANRYATAVEVSRRAYPAGAETVVAVTGASWPDGLSAASLAGVLDAPILLVEQAGVPSTVAAEISRLRPSRVVIIGGEAAVGRGAEQYFAGVVGASNVQRISGSNRFETARLVAEETLIQLEVQGATWDGTYILASGVSFPDVLAASPLAARMAWPVLLTNPEILPPDTEAFLRHNGGASAIVAGGTAAVSERVAHRAAEVAGGNFARVAGSNRYATAASLAQYAVTRGLLDYSSMAVATGANFPDALTVSVLQNKNASVLLLTPGGQVDARVAQVLEGLSTSDYREVTFVGGASAISYSARDQFVSHLSR